MNARDSKMGLWYTITFFMAGILWTIFMYYRHTPTVYGAVLGWIISGGFFILAIIALFLYILSKKIHM